MFQFFQSHKEEKIEINRLMDEAYAKGLPAYQREIGQLLDEAESAGKNDLAQEAEIAMGHYLERVAVSLDSALRKAENEEIKDRYAKAKAEPALAGVEAKEKPAPLSAGDLFRACFYAGLCFVGGIGVHLDSGTRTFGHAVKEECARKE